MRKSTLVSRGFTFIEIVVAISVMAILSTVGLASFVNYSRMQALNTVVYDFSTMLNKAKSRTLSQAIQNGNGENMCGTDAFTGYKVLICTGPAPLEPCINSKGNDYELNIVCAGSINNNSSNPIESKKLPSNISFDTDIGQTTSTSFLFRSVVGGVEGGGRVRINGYGNAYKMINIDAAGNIRISND